MDALLTNAVVLLLVLLAASALVRRLLMGKGASPVPSGGIVMAGGIFAIAALSELALPGIFGRLVVLELLVVWGFLAFSYARSGLSGELGVVGAPMAAFAVGTWVAGSAVLGRALATVLPGWQPLALALWAVAVLVWLWYLTLLPGAFRDAADLSGAYGANGAVLLSTVATLSLVVAGDAVLPGGMPGLLAAALILAGYLFYAVGFVLIGRRYVLRPNWTLADDWDNTNCILHGAMSITGLALVFTGALPDLWAVVTWVWVAAMFVLVEILEIARAFMRARTYGPAEGLFAYHPSQWSRNFTFGMFYAFTLQLYDSPIAMPWAAGLQRAILDYGKYAVLALLVVEAGVFLADRVGAGRLRGGLARFAAK